MIGEDRRCIVLAEQEGHPVAFLVVTRTPDSLEPWELTSLYALPSHFGSGVAGRLYEEFDRIRSGAEEHLEVWNGNARAQAFHRRRGWIPTDRIRHGVAGMPFVTWKLPAEPTSPGVR